MSHSKQIEGDFDDAGLADFIQRFFPFNAGADIPRGTIVVPYSHRSGHLRECFDSKEHHIAPEVIETPGTYLPAPGKQKFLAYPVGKIHSLCFRSRSNNVLKATRGPGGTFTITVKYHKKQKRTAPERPKHRQHTEIGGWDSGRD